MPLESNADKAYMHDLPKVSFRVIDEDPSLLAPAGVQSEQSRSYGYNDFSDFTRSEHYIRYIEPIESELAVQVEYDMDEQDQEWLDAVNAERKKDQSGPISYEIFEILMDKLEKEWFNLSKRIPQPTQHLPAEDSKCAVCDDGEGENSNAIVFCDGCNLAVHQDCYGVPYIPEGQWLCRKCTVSPENPVSCIFCPNEGGAFKQTTTGHWAHLLCAIWVPETGLGNVVYMEPVEGVENVPKSRWKLVCSLCREKTGACIQCDNRNCFTAFHVTCARQVGLLSSMKSFNQDGVLKAFCHKHLPADSIEETETASDYSSSYSETLPPKATKTKNKHRRSSQSHHGTTQVIAPTTKKSAQAHSKSFRPGPPIIPRLILDKVLDYVAKVVMRKRQPFVERLCRYWSLKREARRGAPLLKRLHLEPWTASAASRQQTDAEKAQKLKFLQFLRNDLEKVRMLAELVRKREKEKLRQAQAIKDVVDGFIFPHHGRLRVALERISAMDRSELYLNPVSRLEAPDYFEVIKDPMCWLWIDEKLEKNEYLEVAEFKRDIMLVLDNAMLYNPKDNPYHRKAAKIKKEAEPILADLDGITETARAALGDQNLTESNKSPIGDLEPVGTVLSTLLLESSGHHDPSQDYLCSIFSFELEKPREPTPPPPPKPAKAPRKSNAERRQQWEARDAAAKERSLAGSRPTRAALAAEKVFNQEAGIQPASPAPIETKVEGLDARSRRRSLREINGVEGPTTPATSKKAKGKAPASTKPPSGRKSDTIVNTNLQKSKSTSLTISGSASPTKSTNSFPSRHKSQPGVAGVETFQALTDRERREQEKSLDLLTQEVGAQDQFKRFNVGWVLPEGSKRKRSERTSDSIRE
uniref:NuA3 HAT complex component NTO1 n=1 Tax=Kwoniella pini CBS 10737 TaxID=1296096 RepID=A0A1B9HZ95_9TREE|nr:NuA3 HAT complex component NTO1 [Kwoniella pini CBS 10737]OCF48613.1 NuA3 HAT complex component NTO1 [Kwoniella pini CBS 10737]